MPTPRAPAARGMPAPGLRLPATTLSLLALLALLAPLPAAAASCELAIVSAQVVVDLGTRAAANMNYYEASALAADARFPAIDAGQKAKACGCPDAIPYFAEVAAAAERANVTQFFTSMHQYGDTIRKKGEAGLAELRKCSSK